MPPFFKPCKYCQVTQIKWDNEDSLFREADGRAHDRARCESIRNQKPSNGDSGYSRPSQQQPASQQREQQQQQQQQQQQTAVASYEVANILNTILLQVKLQADATALINQKLEQLSQYYDGIYEHLKQQVRAQEAEAQYDLDRENGAVGSLGNGV